jgi:hypothetical protein
LAFVPDWAYNLKQHRSTFLLYLAGDPSGHHSVVGRCGMSHVELAVPVSIVPDDETEKTVFIRR